MRGLLLAAVLTVACGCAEEKKPAEKGGESKPAEKEKPASLPAATAKLRLESYDAWSAYTDRDPKPHQHESKKVLFKVTDIAYGVKAGGKLLIVEGSDKLFRRPTMVYVLGGDNGFKTGEYSGVVYIEGTFRGATDFASKPWAKDWLKLTEHGGLKDRFVLVEDARLVSEP